MIRYKKLLEFLQTLTDLELEQNVTVYDYNTDEYMYVTDTDKTADNNELDEGHIILIVNNLNFG